MPDSIPNETDILAANEGLTADLKAATDLLTQANAALATLTAERDQLAAQLADARKGNDTLQSVLSDRTKERDALKAELDVLKARHLDFDKSVAAKVAELGIAKSAVEQKIETRPLTLTEECRLAKQ